MRLCAAEGASGGALAETCVSVGAHMPRLSMMCATCECDVGPAARREPERTRLAAGAPAMQNNLPLGIRALRGERRALLVHELVVERALPPTAGSIKARGTQFEI